MKKGFTLAEVLITLVIIGIIASMTIPSIISAKNDKETIARLNKAYSVLTQITTTSKAFNGDFYLWEMVDGDTNSTKYAFDNYISPYIRALKTCVDSTGCWAEEGTKNFAGTSAISSSSGKGIGGNIVTFILNDGISVSIDIYGSDVGNVFGIVEDMFYPTMAFMVDINGAKAPNQIGKDVFAFVLVENGVVPAGKDTGSAKCYAGATGTYAGYDCAAKVLRTGTTQY